MAGAACAMPTPTRRLFPGPSRGIWARISSSVSGVGMPAKHPIGWVICYRATIRRVACCKRHALPRFGEGCIIDGMQCPACPFPGDA